jgi:hypothetical protein
VNESYESLVREAEASQRWADEARAGVKHRRAIAEWVVAALMLVIGLGGLAVILL